MNLIKTQIQEIVKILKEVADPEIPVISLVDLGIIRDIKVDDNQITITISPTYSGCPALDVIPVLIHEALEKAGFSGIIVKNDISEAWSTDWISKEGKQALKAYGIAPPEQRGTDLQTIPFEERIVLCPQCGSANTSMTSKFGSTPCKSLFKCNDCLEPFDYFKCH